MDHAHRITLSFVLLLLVCAGVAIAIPNVRPRATPAAARENLRDFSASALVEVVELIGAERRSVLRGELRHVDRPAGGILRTAQLTGTEGTVGAAVGEAEIEVVEHPNGTRVQELEIDVDGLATDATFVVLVDGQHAGELRTDAYGAGELERYGRIAVPTVARSDEASVLR